MRSMLLAVILAAASASCYGQTATVTVTTAQADADHMARTGVFGHRGRHGLCREGIGFSTVSADAAVRSCCYYGQLRPREIGVSRGRRGFYAVIRYW